MDMITADTPKSSIVLPESWQEFIHQNREALVTMLRLAVKRATGLKCDVLTSFTQPIEYYDPIQVFEGAQSAGLGECFYWEKPTQHNALVGIGTANTIETHGSTSFTDAASSWRKLLQDAIVASTYEASDVYGKGPIFFGGFAFDPLYPRTQRWSAFPDGLLILPSFLLSYSAKRTSLTINKMICANDDAEQCADELLSSITRLFSAIEQVSSFSPENVTSHQLQVQDVQSASEWMAQVANIANEIRQGDYEKVVLARSVRVTPAPDNTSQTFDINAVLHHLRQSYPSAYVFALQRGPHFFIGATPERLVQAQNGQIQTMALAGSAPRGSSEEEDMQLGRALLQSEKNNAEHAIVVAKVRESLLAHCSEVHVSAGPQLLKLKNVQHLETPIVGELLTGRCILDVMADLHPTPAVGGFPRDTALAVIRRVEQLDRGWYAGPLGWIGAAGHGEFAVALRSGLLTNNEATLFAGCGIVADSDPQSEYAESCLKLQVMLPSLSGEN